MGTFSLIHRPIAYLFFRPPEDVLRVNRPRALWDWAFDAIVAHRKTHRLSWDLIKGRRDTRRRYIELVNIRATWYLDDNEEAEYDQIHKTNFSWDLRFWQSLATRMRCREIVHRYVLAHSVSGR